MTCGVKKVHRARVQIAFSTNLSRLQLGPFSKKQKDFLLLWPQRSYVRTKWQIILQIGIPFVVSTFENRRRLKNRRNNFINAISPFFGEFLKIILRLKTKRIWKSLFGLFEWFWNSVLITTVPIVPIPIQG